MSVPDSDMLISISEALDTSVGALLGENMMEPETDTLKAISEKLEVINLQLAQRKKCAAKSVSWSAYFIMRGYSSNFCSLGSIEQFLPELRLQ